MPGTVLPPPADSEKQQILAELRRRPRLVNDSLPGLGLSEPGSSAADIGRGVSFLGGGIPAGVIVMWSGLVANVPSGWAFCDGTNGTPDLRDRFIVAAKQDSGGAAKSNISGALQQSGGSTSYTPAGSVSVSIANHNAGTTGAASAGAQGSGGTLNTLTQAAHTHSFTVSAHVISAQPFTGTAAAIIPPYYALAFIMKL